MSEAAPSDWIEQEFVDGYRDGYDPDAPLAGPNRSKAYRHSFVIGRAEKTKRRLPPASVLLARAERIAAALTVKD